MDFDIMLVLQDIRMAKTHSYECPWQKQRPKERYDLHGRRVVLACCGKFSLYAGHLKVELAVFLGHNVVQLFAGLSRVTP